MEFLFLHQKGCETFLTKRVQVQRYDFEVQNKFQLRLRCSYYQPESIEPSRSCVIYLHSLNGSRLESTQFVENFCDNGICFAHFDFSACGLSDGEYVTFGANQSDDIIDVIQYIQNRWSILYFAIWGRSMGAVSGLLCSQQLKNMCALVLDSPFVSIQRLAEQLFHQKTNFPGILVKGALALVKGSIEEKAQFQIEDVDVLKNIQQCNSPIMLIASQNDGVIPYQHTKDIYQNLRGEKSLITINEDHNEARTKQTISEIIQFLTSKLIHGAACVGGQLQEQTIQPSKSIEKSQQIVSRSNLNEFLSNLETNEGKIDDKRLIDHAHTSRPSKDFSHALKIGRTMNNLKEEKETKKVDYDVPSLLSQRNAESHSISKKFENDLQKSEHLNSLNSPRGVETQIMHPNNNLYFKESKSFNNSEANLFQMNNTHTNRFTKDKHNYFSQTFQNENVAGFNLGYMRRHNLNGETKSNISPNPIDNKNQIPQNINEFAIHHRSERSPNLNSVSPFQQREPSNNRSSNIRQKIILSNENTVVASKENGNVSPHVLQNLLSKQNNSNKVYEPYSQRVENQDHFGYVTRNNHSYNNNSFNSNIKQNFSSSTTVEQNLSQPKYGQVQQMYPKQIQSHSFANSQDQKEIASKIEQYVTSNYQRNALVSKANLNYNEQLPTNESYGQRVKFIQTTNINELIKEQINLYEEKYAAPQKKRYQYHIAEPVSSQIQQQIMGTANLSTNHNTINNISQNNQLREYQTDVQNYTSSTVSNVSQFGTHSQYSNNSYK